MNTTDAPNSFQENECVTPENAFQATLYVLIFPIFQIIINVVVIVAALRSKRKLRHNFVYVYVINTLVANVLFGLFSGYQILAYFVPIEKIEGHSNKERIYDGDTTIKNWWTFRTAFVTGLFLVMSGSISALIYGIRESSYFVGKSTIHFNRRSDRLASTSSQKPSFSMKFYRMMTIISITWLVPLLTAVAATAGWSCVKHCLCTAGYYGDLYFCHADELRYCSRFYQPHANSFLILFVVLWTLLSIVIIYLNVTTIRKYVVLVINTRKQSAKSSQAEINEASTRRSDAKEEDGCSVFSNQVSKTLNRGNVQRHWISLFPFNRNIKLLLIISISFIVCTMPIVGITLTDITSTDYSLPYVVVVGSLMLPLIYCSVSPIVLICYMPRLRKAIVDGFFRWSCCTTTTVSSGRNPSSSTDRSSSS